MLSFGVEGKNVIKSIELLGWVKLGRPGQVVPGRAEFRFGASGVGARLGDSSSLWSAGCGLAGK